VRPMASESHDVRDAALGLTTYYCSKQLPEIAPSLLRGSL
jgi:hypothetical protein